MAKIELPECWAGVAEPQRIDDELAQAGSGAAVDYGALEQRVADALGEVEPAQTGGAARGRETAPTRIGAVTPDSARKSQY